MHDLMRRWRPGLSRNPMREFKRFLDSPFFDFWEQPFPATDVKDLKETVEVTIDLPGLDKNNINIEYIDNLLKISGKTESESKLEEEDFYRQERYYGSFERSIALPSGVDCSQAQARYKNGVLKIVIPKTETTSGNRIEID